MILDALEQFDAPASAITVTRVSGNVLDVGISNAQQPSGNQQRDIGPAYVGVDSLDILVIVDALFVTGDAATLQVSIQAAVDNGGVAGTYYDQVMTGVISVANLVAGRELLRTPVPRWQIAAANTNRRPRFYRLNYTVGTGSFSAGSVQAYLVASGGRQDNHSYVSGIPATA